MPSFLVFGIYFLLLLSGDGERVGWNCFLYDSSVEDEDDSYSVSILTGMTVILLFLDGDIKAEMVPSPWNNFLRSLLSWLDLVTIKD
jgi:hypothetical protein